MMKKTTLIYLLFICNITFAQNNFLSVINYHTTNAASEIRIQDYNEAANSLQDAITVFYKEMDKATNKETFLNKYFETFLVLNYDKVWCCLLILQKGTVKDFDYLIEDIISSLDFILSSPFLENPKIVNGNFTIENVYTMVGITKYLLEIDGYKDDLLKGGISGVNYLERIKVAESYDNKEHKYQPEIKPLFSVNTTRKISN